MSKATLFVLFLIFLTYVGNEFVRNMVDVVWLIIWIAFIAFLFIHDWMDHKGMFLPKNNNKH